MSVYMRAVATLDEFIDHSVYQSEWDKAIRRRCPNVGTIGTGERRLWILNDEVLYNWARAAGVKDI